MQIYLNDMLYALSYALDCVEAEFLGVRTHHAARVAYLCVKMGKAYGLAADELVHLAAAAVLHDNALTEYVSLRDGKVRAVGTKQPERLHCEMGERNVLVLPFYPKIAGAILYHHEHADGSGPFGRKRSDIPLFAQLIHLGDQLDNSFPLDEVDAEKHRAIGQYLHAHTGTLFMPEMTALFQRVFAKPLGTQLAADLPETRLREVLPDAPRDYDALEIEALATVFARITDYKSHFTCTHSQGIACKARRLGIFLGCDEAMGTKLYLAGALHDIGKLTIPNTILEKPGHLTRQEFEVMKRHALVSWKILSRITGLSDVAEWAGMHHEKLNGTGYPFGRPAESLGPEARMLACVDIYQALREERPYKGGVSHQAALKVMNGMVRHGFIDREMTEAVGDCFHY